MARISTHVLDIAKGKPAAGIAVELYFGLATVAIAKTNADGRTDEPLFSAETLEPGGYDLMFHVGDYFRAQGIEAFFEKIPIRFVVTTRRPIIMCRCCWRRTATALIGDHDKPGGESDRVLPRTGVVHRRAGPHYAHVSLAAHARCPSLAGRVDGAYRDAGLDRCGGESARASWRSDAPRLIIGSHLDTVPNAGAFDGILGVVMGIALAEASQLNGEWLSKSSDFRKKKAFASACPSSAAALLTGGLGSDCWTARFAGSVR